MENDFLRVLAEAERRKWCVRPWCSTCGNRPFRAAVAKVPDLQAALESVDLRQLVSHSTWCDALRIVVMDNGATLNWERILASWLPFAKEHVDFADHVFFYLVRRLVCMPRTFAAWKDMCIDLALETRHTSLVESLVRVLGTDVTQHDDLLAIALEESSRSCLLRDALVKARVLPSAEDIRRERKREIAGMRLFGAIRRNDIRAVRALVARGAFLSVADEQGRTPLQYARSLSRAEVAAILESANARQEGPGDSPRKKRGSSPGGPKRG